MSPLPSDADERPPAVGDERPPADAEDRPTAAVDGRPPADADERSPAAVVLASLSAAPDPGLDELLGAAAAAALREELGARARRWAAAAAPELAFEATSPLMAAAALRGHDGPVLLVAADVPTLGSVHADAALDDLADGIDVVYAATGDGSPFLLALPRMDAEQLDLLDAGFDAFAAAATSRGGGIGMLRSERRLVSPADARALAADPGAPEELVRHLREALAVRRERDLRPGRRYP